MQITPGIPQAHGPLARYVPTRAWLKPNLALAIAMLLLGLAGLLIRNHFPTATAWLPSGLALGAFLIYGPRVVPGAFLGSVILGIAWTENIGDSLIFGGGNVAACYIAWFLLQLGKRFDPKLTRVTDVARLLAYGAATFAIINALFGTLSAPGLHQRTATPNASAMHGADHNAAHGVDHNAHSGGHSASHSAHDAAPMHHKMPSTAPHVMPEQTAEPHTHGSASMRHDQHAAAPDAMRHSAEPTHEASAPVKAAGTGHDEGHHPHGKRTLVGDVFEWWLADVLGILLIAPVVLAFHFRKQLPFRSAMENLHGATPILFLLLAVTSAIYSGFLEEKFGVRHTTLFVLPPAVWLALQHNVVHTLIGNIAVYFITVTGTALGHGPFADHTSGLPLLMAVFTLTTLLIAAGRTERRIAEERIHHLATRDALTDLPNRTLLASHLSDALASAQRYQHTLAVLFIDLDHFKRINDSLGHAVGDALLTAAANRIAASLRCDSTLARVGGDEFVAVLDRLGEMEVGSLVAQRITHTLSQPFDISGHVINISCSVGISIFPADATQGPDLIRNADLAMYEAKKSGRNNFRFFSAAMNEQVLKRHEMEKALRTALKENEFFLCYQPIVAIASGETIGLEALLRWRQSGNETVILPGEFISLAEQTGLIEPIGKWVIRSACAQLRNWLDKGYDPLPISVNLSVKQLRHSQNLTEMLSTTLAEFSISPQLFEMEITESLLLQEDTEMEEVLQQLHQLGIRIAIDDFGTGYSSLTYLRKIPVHHIKIDKSFIDQMETKHADLTLVKTMVQMGHTLNLKVTAEGVETQAQLELLRTLGADNFQGFLFAYPMLAEEIEKKFSIHWKN